MDIKTLRVLVAVADCGNLTRAGQKLGYTQSGVSHIIKNAEDTYGFPLFIRTTRSLRLTDNGAQLLPLARELLRLDAQLYETADAIRGVDRGELRIASYTSVSVRWLPTILKRFCGDYPGIEVQLFEGGESRVEEMLAAGAADVGFLSRSGSMGEMEFLPLAKDQLMVTLQKGHPLTRMKNIPLSALRSEPFILYAPGVDRDIGRVLQEGGIDPKIAFTSADDQTIIAMVESGLGVSILPDLMLRGFTHAVEARPIAPVATRTLGVLLPSLAMASPAARKFIAYTQQFIDSQQGQA